MQQLKKTILTLVALLALTTQAWATDVYVVGNGEGNWLNGKNWDPGAAENKMTEQNGVYSITFTNVDDNSNLQFKFAINGSWTENYGCSLTTEIELNKTISNKEDGDNITFELTEPADVTISFNLSEQTFMISTNGMKVAPSATPVDLTRGTGEKINEWTLTNGMPAGNVLVTVAYKDRTATTVKFGETTITPTSNAVTGYIGFEAAFANQIAATVQNIEPTFNQGQAVDVNTPTITYKSSNTDVIAFKIADGEDLAEGPLNLMLFRAPGTATLTVQYTGTADLGKSSVDLTVTVAEPATLTLATNDVTRGTVEAVVTDPIQFMKCTDANEWDVLGPQGFQGMTMSQASTWTWDPTTGDAKLVYYIEQDGCMHNIGYNEDGNYCIGAGCHLNDFSSDIQGGKFYYTTGVNAVNILAARNSETNLVIPGTYKVIPGSEVTLKATPTEGNLLNGWSTEGLTQNEDGKWTVTVGQTTTLAANFVEKTYTVKMAENTADAAKWQGSLDGGQSYADLPIVSVKNNPVTLNYSGRLKVKNVTATFEPDPMLATPLTIEAITPGTIQVNMTGTLSSGMKYSVNGNTPTLIKTTTPIEGLKAGDKVQFYGNGTQTQAYGIGPVVSIQGSGDGFQTKVYGNIMSLLDETGFATKTDLPNESLLVFSGLFAGNTTLIDASELLLPAATLTNACYQQMFDGCTSLTKAPKLPATTLATSCYAYMFNDCQLLTAAPKLPATELDLSCYYCMFSGCTSLTTAPKLPATTLATDCYWGMFMGCTSLTSAYVKAAYTEERNQCFSMFEGCSADGAVLHTTSDSKASWEAMMGMDNTWDNWSVADDWQE